MLRVFSEFNKINNTPAPNVETTANITNITSTSTSTTSVPSTTTATITNNNEPNFFL